MYLCSRNSIIAKMNDNNRKNNLYENNSLIALRDTLLPKLLSGELDVSGVQDEVA